MVRRAPHGNRRHHCPRLDRTTLASPKSPRDNWRPFLKRKEEAKHAKYDVPCDRESGNFAAIAIGTWGGLGPEGAKVLSRILKRCSAWEDPAQKGLSQRTHSEAVGVALFRHIFALLRANNNLR